MKYGGLVKNYPLLDKQQVSELPEFIRYGYDKNKDVKFVFNNIAHIAHIVKHYINELPDFRTSSRKEDTSWSGTETLEQAIDLVLGKDVKEFSQKQDDIKNTVINKLRKMGMINEWMCETFTYNVEGEELDIIKYIEGETNCYVTSNKEYVSTFYDLTVSLNFAYLYNVEDIARNIYTILKVVKDLEKEKNIKIRINGALTVKNTDVDNRKFLVYFPLKDFDKPLDLSAIISAVYPSFFRRVIFAMMEMTFGTTLKSSYGESESDYDHIISISKERLTEEEISQRVMKTIVD